MNRFPSKSQFARDALACAVLCAFGPPAAAQETNPPSVPPTTVAQSLPPVTVQGNYDNAVGTSDAASQGTVTSRLIENRPLLRPAEVLEFVPGVIVTQHSGDGKANQFHSNEARGVTASVTAKTGDPIDPAKPLVRTKGSELGLRSEMIPGLQSSLALWQLKLGSELLVVGDAGETEASRASKRYGVEWNNHTIAAPWLLFDLDLAVSRARFTEPDPADPTLGNHPRAPSTRWPR